MPPSELSRRALLGLGLSRLGARLDEAAAPARAVWDPAPVTAPGPSAVELAARWVAARSAQGDALWADVDGQLRGLVAEVAHPGEDDPAVSVFGPQSVPQTRQALDALFAPLVPGALVAFSVWTTGTVAQLLKAAAELDPMPAGLAGVWGWGSRERLRQDLDHHADEIHYRRRELRIAAASAAAATDRLAGAVPALGAALERHGDEARERFAAIGELYARPGPSGVDLPVTYLLVAARRR